MLYPIACHQKGRGGTNPGVGRRRWICRGAIGGLVAMALSAASTSPANAAFVSYSSAARSSAVTTSPFATQIRAVLTEPIAQERFITGATLIGGASTRDLWLLFHKYPQVIPHYPIYYVADGVTVGCVVTAPCTFPSPSSSLGARPATRTTSSPSTAFTCVGGLCCVPGDPCDPLPGGITLGVLDYLNPFGNDYTDDAVDGLTAYAASWRGQSCRSGPDNTYNYGGLGGGDTSDQADLGLFLLGRAFHSIKRECQPDLLDRHPWRTN